MVIISLMSLQIAANEIIVECEDETGHRSFRKSCPPGYKTINEKVYSTSSGISKKRSSTNITATLYLIPGCELCDDVKEFLINRKIPITEKNVKDDIQLQEELKEKAGELRVPVVVIGEKVISGYQRNTMISALKEAGYIEENGE